MTSLLHVCICALILCPVLKNPSKRKCQKIQILHEFNTAKNTKATCCSLIFSLILHNITGKIMTDGQGAMRNDAVCRKGRVIITQKY